MEIKIFKQNTKYCIIIVLWLMFVLAIHSCNNDSHNNTLKNIKNDTNAAEQICYNLNIKFIDSNIIKASITADKAEIFDIREHSNIKEEQRDTTLISDKLIENLQSLKTENKRPRTDLSSNVKVTFYNKNGKKSGNLTADYITINDLTKDIIATGNVIVVSDSTSTRLDTEELVWKNTTRMLYSRAFVKIKTPSEYIEGYGFQSDDKLNNYRIFKVSGVK